MLYKEGFEFCVDRVHTRILWEKAGNEHGSAEEPCCEITHVRGRVEVKGTHQGRALMVNHDGCTILCFVGEQCYPARAQLVSKRLRVYYCFSCGAGDRHGRENGGQRKNFMY